MSNPDYKDIGVIEDRVIEECSELIKSICKVKRFGWNNYNPFNPILSNMEKIISEMNDVIEVIKEFFEKRDLFIKYNINIKEHYES